MSKLSFQKLPGCHALSSLLVDMDCFFYRLLVFPKNYLQSPPTDPARPPSVFWFHYGVTSHFNYFLVFIAVNTDIG